MDKEFWHRRWEKNEIGFHLTKPHHYLQKFVSVLQLPPGSTVFVPLCGKSPDLIWLLPFNGFDRKCVVPPRVGSSFRSNNRYLFKIMMLFPIACEAVLIVKINFLMSKRSENIS